MDSSMHDISSPTVECTPCTKNIEMHPLDGAHTSFVKDNQSYPSDYQTYHETTQSTFFVQDVTASSSLKVRDKPISMERISELLSLTCTS